MINDVIIVSKWLFFNVIKHPIALALRMLCYIVTLFFVSDAILAFIIATTGIVDSFIAADWEDY